MALQTPTAPKENQNPDPNQDPQSQPQENINRRQAQDQRLRVPPRKGGRTRANEPGPMPGRKKSPWYKNPYLIAGGSTASSVLASFLIS